MLLISITSYVVHLWWVQMQARNGRGTSWDDASIPFLSSESCTQTLSLLISFPLFTSLGYPDSTKDG